MTYQFAIDIVIRRDTLSPVPQKKKYTQVCWNCYKCGHFAAEYIQNKLLKKKIKKPPHLSK